MASKNHLLDMQNDDQEIDLQFQDFENNEQKQGQAVYISSFPDSIEDDHEQKLLGEDSEDSQSKATHSFWTFEYYQQYFDVESKQVADRIIWSMVPKPGVNYLQSYIRPNPDLYGPFWICITLVFTTAIAGNLSNYLQTTEGNHWRYDFHKVTLATSSIFSYAWLVPVLIWGVLLWRGSKSNVSLLELICLYGYSLAVFVPVSLLWMIPLRWLQWCLGIVASVLSGSVLVRTIKPAVSHEAKKVALSLAVLVLVLHAALALGFMLYFFYPPTTHAKPLHEVKPVESSNFPATSKSKGDKNLQHNSGIGNKQKESYLPGASENTKQERSEKIVPNIPISVQPLPKEKIQERSNEDVNVVSDAPGSKGVTERPEYRRKDTVVKAGLTTSKVIPIKNKNAGKEFKLDGNTESIKHIKPLSNTDIPETPNRRIKSTSL